MDLQTIRKEWVLHPTDFTAETSAWDSTAEEYVYEEKNTFEDDPFLKFVAEKVALTKDMRTLDVGCGAGAYSVAMAAKVGQADGVDLSPRMVELGSAWAREHGIDNLHLWVSNWHTCDVIEFRRKYDLVFAHTTPAIADYSTLVKLCEASRRYCFLCSPARRTDQIFDELRRIAGNGGRRRADDAVVYSFETLWGLGYNPEISCSQTVWLPRKSIEEAETWYLGRLRGSCPLNDKTVRKIRDYLRETAVDGFVHERIETTLVNMFWRVDI